MKHLLHWILALATVFAVAGLSGAWSPSQEPPKPQQKKMEKPPQRKLENKSRAAKHAALRAIMPSMKTNLAEAIQLAEKETGGKAFTAGIEILEGKPSIQVNLFVGEKFTVADVNPETKKVTVAPHKRGEDGGEEEGGEGGGEGEGGEEKTGGG